MNNDVELIPVKGVSPSVQVQSDNVIYVPQAHKNKAGIVKEGDGVLIENGVVSLNKQTVEDMIDANKWVSYGFKQNLTEDEKGMARHNIGAGDNYFTGSYYDLTQKPHLNTNNTTGLDYGDEVLNDTINLHKISKTGSFNDLKHVPQETIDFAESERQKSKNLLSYPYVSGSTTISGVSFSCNSDGSLTVTGTSTSIIFYTLLKGKELKQGNYTFSVRDDNGQFIKNYAVQIYDEGGNLIVSAFTPKSFSLSKNIFARIVLKINSNLSFNGKYYFQLEEGSVATEYQPYNGQITHNGDAPVVFAEDERQKSKNLLNIPNASSYTTNGVTLTIEDNIITLNGTTTGFTTFIRPHQLISTNVGKYAFSFKHISGTISGNSGPQSLYNQVGKKEIYYPKTSIINDITSPTDYNQLRIAISANITFDNFKYSLQYEQGDVATDYQPYNGALVHEKENPYPLLEYHELLLSANQTVNYETNTDLSFDTVPTNSAYISVNSDKNSFTILKPCKIKITGIIFFDQSTNPNVDMHIMKNTTEIIHCFALKFNDNKGMLFNIPPKIMDMSTNDTFSLKLMYGGSGATASMKHFYTRVLVEVFKQ